MARIRLRQKRQNLDDSRLTKGRDRKVERAAHYDIGICACMKMPMFAFEVDAARLLDHTIIVCDLYLATDLLQCRTKSLWRYFFGCEPLPTTAMDEDAIFDREFFPDSFSAL